MTLGVGVLGAGLMGSHHVHTLASEMAGANVVAVADPDRERAARVAAEVSGCRCHNTGLELVHDREVEAVLVASPAETHEELVLACLAAGKPVLCEKPLAATADACLRVIQVETGLGRKLVQVGFMRRFDSAYAEMKRRVDAGAIGRALLMHCVHRGVATVPSFTSEMMITDAAIHELDLARWMLREEIVAVTVHAPRTSGQAAPGLQDPLVIVLQSESGVLVDIEVFGNARYGYDIRGELVGETGTISLASPSPAIVTIRQHGEVRLPIASNFGDRFAHAYRTELRMWVEGVCAGEVRGPDSWDGYAAIAVAEACLESLEKGGQVQVQLASRPHLFTPTSGLREIPA